MTKQMSTLFLGDLSPLCLEDTIEDLFAPYGQALKIRIKRNKESGRSLCYGFIQLSSQLVAAKAMKDLNGVVLFGRPIRIGWAMNKPSSEAVSAANAGVKREGSSVHVKFSTFQSSEKYSDLVMTRVFSAFGEVVKCSIKQQSTDQVLINCISVVVCYGLFITLFPSQYQISHINI